MEDSTVLYSAISAFLLFLSFKFFFKSRASHINLPPSPRSIPILGHLHLIKPPIHRAFLNLSKKYGPIVSLKFGCQLVVMVSSPSAVEECFTKNDIVLANRPQLLMGKHLGYNYTNMVNSSYGDHWRNLRRISAIEIFSSARLNMFVDVRKDEIMRLLKKLSRNSFQDFAKVEVKLTISDLTFNNIIRMVAGKRYYGEDVGDEREARQFRELIGEVFEHSGATNPGDFVPILNWINRNYERKVKRLGETMDRRLQKMIDEIRSKQQGNTMIHRLLSLQQSQPQYYTDQIIKGLILVLVLAGTDTTAATLEWALSALLNNPDVLKKARDELDAEVGQENLIDEPHLTKLPYLQNIISETFRLYPVAPLLVPHLASNDCTIGEHNVPRNTMVLINAWAIQRDPNLWDDPLVFKPERFENGETESYKFMPFGLGRRACPGESLALRVVGLTLGSLIQCFDWKRVGKEEIDMTEKNGATMPKAQPLVAMCKARPIISKVIPEAIKNV
ncbi:cytochrome P450 81D11-like [Durio zibethinus]|uniref:Cytochrome P450 81D11-like n=1 Tax=Durio zibethinus TaxID=66656 RepID=A0A6P6AC75_DURZI|nr:cytochrome P450 81D11-like [Durio zibethinus]